MPLPFKVNEKLTKKEKNANNIKQNPQTGGVGTQLGHVGCESCLSVPRRIQTNRVCEWRSLIPTVLDTDKARSMAAKSALTMDTGLSKLWALVYDILPSRRKVPESDAQSVRPEVRHSTQTSPDRPCSCIGLSIFWRQKRG